MYTKKFEDSIMRKTREVAATQIGVRVFLKMLSIIVNNIIKKKN